MQKKKGISLIVLAITIIIMTILATAIIISLNNAGVINNANKGVDDTDIKEIRTIVDLAYADYLIQKSEDSLEDYVKAKVLQSDKNYEKKCTITVIDNKPVVVKVGTLADLYVKNIVKTGDYVAYDAGNNSKVLSQYNINCEEYFGSNVTISSTSTMKWRVLGINSKGEVQLVLEGKAVVVGNKYNNGYALYGKDSYFNAETILNNACEVFGRGKFSTGARSIKREDIDRIIGIDYSNLYSFQGVNSFNYILLKYNSIVKTGSDTNNLSGHRLNVMLIEDKLYHFTDDSGNQVTNTPYTFRSTGCNCSIVENIKNITTSSPEYKMLFRDIQDTNNIGYWLANTTISLEVEEFSDIRDAGICYAIANVDSSQSGIVYSGGLMCYGTKDKIEYNINANCLKPVVSIATTAVGILNGINSSTNPWILN